MAAPGHAIITGGSSGIGLETARILAGRGMRVTLMARDPARLAAARAALSATGGAAVATIAVDVGDRGALTAAIGQAIAENGPPGLLVTSAGLAIPGYVSELPDSVFDETMRVNYFGTLTAVRAVCPAMRAAGGGRIVMISSGAGLLGLFGYAAYSPSKFAVRGLAEALDSELRRDGIRVSVVYPPDTDTPQLAAETRLKPPETRLMTGTARVWSAPAVAARIVRGIDCGQSTITPGWEMTALYRLGGVVGPILQAYWAWRLGHGGRGRI